MVELYIRKFSAQDGTKVIGAESASCMIYNNESGFIEHFPFNSLADWKILMWLIHWNANHWVIYCANTLDHTSMLLDPLSETLSPDLAIFHGRLDRTIQRLSYPMNSFTLKQVRCPHPTQQNGFDCGVFAAHFAVTYSRDPLTPVFMIPDAKKIRKDMHSAVVSYNRNKKIEKKGAGKERKKGSSSVDKEFLNSMCDALDMDTKHISECLSLVINHIVSKSEDKSKKNFIKPLIGEIRQEMSNESDFISTCKLQRNYNRQPKKTFESLLNNSSGATTFPTIEAINNHFTRKKRDPFTMSSRVEFPFLADDETNRPVTKEEILAVYNGLVDNSCGSDNLDFSDWKNFDPDGIFLATLFSAIIRKKMQPDAWRVFRTTLILKPGKENESEDVGNWRPIAILDTVYRIFSKLMNKRLMRWIREGNLMSNVQKAIGQPDGCSEHNFILTSIEEEAKRNKKSVHMVWLDLTDAFGSVPHDLIWFTLEKMGLNVGTIDLFKDMYRDNKSVYQCGKIYSDEIELKQGVKQGCPLSMTLFCLSIDFLVKEMHRFPGALKIHDYIVPILAYADDLVLFANSNSLLQRLIDRICKLATGSHLVFKPAKCGYYIVGEEKKDLEIKIYGTPISFVDETNLYKYLGVPHGNPKRQSVQNITEKAKADYEIILKSKLSMRQKVSVYKTFIAPRFIFALRTFDIPVWQLNTNYSETPENADVNGGYDVQFGISLKNALGLPKNCINDFMFTGTGLGGFGITQLYDEYIVQTLNGMYCIFNSADTMVREISRAEIVAVTAKRHVLSLNANIVTAMRWLKDEKLANRTRNAPATWWTRVKAAIRRIKKFHHIDVKLFVNGSNINMQLIYEFKDRKKIRDIDEKNCSNLCSILHEFISMSYYDRWLSKKYYGALVKCVSRSEHSLHIFKDPTVSDDVWRFTILGRMNSLVLSCTSGRRFDDTLTNCRRCIGEVDANGHAHVETQCHVLQCCTFNKGLISKRHDNIAEAFHRMLLNLDIDAEWEIPVGEVTTRLRPDIIVRTKKHNYLIDIKAPYDEIENMNRARLDNVGKYSDLANDMRKTTKKGCSVETFIVGALGSWDPANNDLLRKLTVSDAEQLKLAKLVTISSIKDSCYIYNRHRSTKSCQGIVMEQRRLEREEEEAAGLIGLLH